MQSLRSPFLRSPPCRVIPGKPFTPLKYAWSTRCMSCYGSVPLPFLNILIPKHTHTLFVQLSPSWRYLQNMITIGRVRCVACGVSVQPTHAMPWGLVVNGPCHYELRETRADKFLPSRLYFAYESRAILSTSSTHASQHSLLHWNPELHATLLLSTQVVPQTEHSHSI